MSSVSVTADQPVVIVGAGPVGLTLAWRLTQAGVPVRVLESEPAITDQLRASTFHPPTLDMFAPSGITQTLHEQGQVTPTWQVRLHPSGERAEFDLGVLAQDT
ncbi:MAG: FAD-dependent oxidoreductase, partial [Burkholderiaceae bacterium]